jgi:hypothetical protein
VAVLDRGRLVAHAPLAELLGATVGSVLELTFTGVVPEPPFGTLAWPVPNGFAIRTEDPGRDAARTLAALGPAAAGLSSLQVMRPGLEGLFLTLTGGHHDADRSPETVAVA